MECSNNTDMGQQTPCGMGDVEKKVLDLIKVHAPIRDIIRVVAAGTDDALRLVSDDAQSSSGSSHDYHGIKECLLRVPLNVHHALDTDMHLYDLLEIMGRSINDLTLHVNNLIDYVDKLEKRVESLEEEVGSNVPVSSISLSASLSTIYSGSTIKSESTITPNVYPATATNKNVTWTSSDATKATVDANGKVTAVAPGAVTITCTAADGSGVSKAIELNVVQKALESSVDNYGTPVVSLSYGKVSNAGGYVNPTMSYSQTHSVTKTYNDGSSTTESLASITSGGSVSYEKTSGDATLSADGKVTYSSANATSSEKEVAKVKAKVVLNGKTGESSVVSVKQSAYVESWYLGQITKTKSEFAALSTNDLISASTAVPTTTKTKDITINNSVWYVLLPSGTTPASAKYISSSGITSQFTASEITGGVKWACTHDDVTINGKTYKVYGNRNTALVDSGAAGTFNIN